MSSLASEPKDTRLFWAVQLYLLHTHRRGNQVDRRSARGQHHRNPHLHRHSSDYSRRHRNLRGTLKWREENTVDDMLTSANTC